MLKYVDYLNEKSNELENTFVDNENFIFSNEIDDCETKISSKVLKNKIIVFAKTLNGKPIPIEITQNTSINKLKTIIQNEMEISTNDYYLQYHGQYLNDNKTLKYYEISNKSLINVINKLRGGVNIFGKTVQGQNVTIEIVTTEKVIDLKKKIQDKIGMQTNEQRLIFKGVVLEDDKLLEEYKLTDNSEINIAHRPGGISILVKMLDGKTVAMDVSKNEKVIDLKEKIKEKVGILVEEQKLVYQGKLLVDENELGEYEIVEKSVVNLIVRLKGGTQACRH